MQRRRPAKIHFGVTREERNMAIISFPVERVTGIIESNAYSNLKNFIAICDDNRTLEFYAVPQKNARRKVS